MFQVYRHLKYKLIELDDAKCFIPVKGTREFKSYHNICSGYFCPSCFDEAIVEEYINNMPEQGYSSRGLKFCFLVQYCWEDPAEQIGFFKIKVQYPIEYESALFNVKELPILRTTATKFNPNEKPAQVADYLLEIMKGI